jgi:hypothetical protein
MVTSLGYSTPPLKARSGSEEKGENGKEKKSK